MIQTDILIVGAGPVGAHAAKLLAQKGFQVVVIEKSDMSACGAQWVNGVPFWQLEEAGLGMPPKEEIYHEGGIFTMISPIGKSRITIKDAPLFDIDMRRFGQRLLQVAESEKNVRVCYRTTFESLEFDGNERPVSAITSAGKIKFKLVIDCSGLSGVVRKQVPLLAKLCPRVSTEDLCTAAQEVREISDVHGAMSFLEQNQAVGGEALAWVNVAGGFSLLRVHIDPSLSHVAFLTGARPLPGNTSAMELIRQFVSDHDWVGSKMFGGQRPVPLRRPYAALGAPGVALLGDAGCQVYSAHASGIGVSLIAASILADCLVRAQAKGEDIASAEVVSQYAREFHRNWGALLINSDASRRFSQGLSKEDTHFLIDRKLMTTNMISDSLFQRPVSLSMTDLPGQALQALKHPLLVQRVLRVAAKMPAVAAMIKFYPAKGVQDPAAMLRFEKRLEKIVSF